VANPFLAFGLGVSAWEGGKWLLKKAAPSLFTTTQEAAQHFPVLEDEVVVDVRGQPGASKQQLYYLALGAAHRVVRRFGNILTFNPIAPPTYAAIMIEYDAAENWVRSTVRYVTGMTSLAVGTSILKPKLVGRSENFDKMAVYRGPQCAVVGGGFDFVSSLPGIPGSSNPADGAPQLNYVGQTILTGCPEAATPTPANLVQPPVPSQPLVPNPGPLIPAPNPKPPGDNRSRGVAVAPLAAGEFPGCCPKTLELIPLVYAALTDPGSYGTEMFTPPTAGPAGR
jgi:hypothetical protein